MKTDLTLSWRIGLKQWETDEAFDRLLALLLAHRSVVDQVWLFDTVTHHLFIPLDVYARRMEVAAARMEVFRKKGIAAGVNVLCTLGHVNEAWSFNPSLPFQPFVGHDGSVSRGCACPNTPELKAYVRAKYELVAQARPDSIWVDDDLRMHHHGMAWGCFCPACLALFEKECGKAWSRPDLAAALDQPDQGPLREQWVERNIASLEGILSEVRQAVRGVAPATPLGLMTCGPGWTTYSGQAFERWYKALGATLARPGGGFYSDGYPVEMTGKALECGFQRACLPAVVEDVQYELENFPYQRLKKSRTAVLGECSLALAHGLNGIAFNMLGMTPSMEDSLAWMEKLPAARPAWEAWVSHTAGLRTAGLWPAWSPRLMARRSVRPGESWLGWSPAHDISRPKVLAEIGLPLASEPGGVAVLCGRVGEAFTDAELRALLAGPLMLDSNALAFLEERGLGELAGVRLGRRHDNGIVERFTDDPLNGPGAGLVRDARIEFWGNALGMADSLEPVGGGVRRLSVLEDYAGHAQGTGLTLFENELGGRVAVLGYAPWLFLHSIAKRRQLQNVADWLAPGRLPVRIEETLPLVPVVRLSPDRARGGVLLLNAGMDPVEEATVRLRAPARRVRVLALDGKESWCEVETSPEGGAVVLRNIEPWGVRFLLWKEA